MTIANIIQLANEEASIAFAKQLAIYCEPPLLIYLQGEIGVGKTTLIRALLRALGVQGAIKSPTFTLLEMYSIASWYFYHVDLYRLSAAEELEYIGLRDYLTEQAVCCIEWPERAGHYLPQADLTIHLNCLPCGREVRLTAGSPMGQQLLDKISP